MTYFLMLLFVFLTLLSIGEFLFNYKSNTGFFVGLAWACLGTFFFHNIW